MINLNSQEGCDIPVSAGASRDKIAVDNNMSGSVTFFVEYWQKRNTGL